MTIVATPGQPTSNAYGTLTEFKAYCDERGFSYPTTSGADDQIEAEIINGAAYLDGRYRGKWRGRKTYSDQALAWPRAYVVDEDGYEVNSLTIPVVVARANFEAARRLLDSVVLSPDLERGGAIAMERVKAGPVESETEYRGDAASRIAVTAIDDLLSGLLSGGRGQAVLVRS